MTDDLEALDVIARAWHGWSEAEWLALDNTGRAWNRQSAQAVLDALRKRKAPTSYDTEAADVAARAIRAGTGSTIVNGERVLIGVEGAAYHVLAALAELRERRGVVEAPREPTAAMLGAGANPFLGVCTIGFARKTVADAWEAMIATWETAP